MTTRSAAFRWLNSHVGATIATVQQDENGHVIWHPGDRTLSVRNKSTWLLNTSAVVISDEHTVVEADERLVLDWHDERGRLIHRTTYTVV